MKAATLKFPTILALVDFQMVTKTDHLEVSTVHLTLTGEFAEADIELAKYGYEAEVMGNAISGEKHHR